MINYNRLGYEIKRDFVIFQKNLQRAGQTKVQICHTDDLWYSGRQ